MDYANIILEMLERIKKLESDVEELKVNGYSMSGSGLNVCTNAIEPSKKRDTTRYLFNGNVYLKNRLVLAVVKAYVSGNSQITCEKLKSVFPKALQGSIGVVSDVYAASQRKDFKVRFFTKDDEVIHLVDGDVYVCSQWGVLNIPYFLKRAEQLGYIVEKI